MAGKKSGRVKASQTRSKPEVEAVQDVPAETMSQSDTSVQKTKESHLEKKDSTPIGSKVKFHEMGLDRRLLKSINRLKWPQPTPIQEKAIPLALQGKDVLSRARTGSGKTAAYSIPIIQTLLSLKEAHDEARSRVLILVPSKELSQQVFQMLSELLFCCSDSIHCLNLAVASSDDHGSSSNATPDIIVGTPSRVLAQTSAGQLNLSDITWLVIDEADLVLSFGYEDEIKKVVLQLPASYQSFVTSATFSEDINSLKNLVLKNPVVLQLEETALPTSERLTQYHVICESEDDKYILLYALLKLKLLHGKALIFVNSITRCYRLKLFLEQFSIFCCVLNSELPVRSRIHAVEQFNKGHYDYMIAADEDQLFGPKVSKRRRKAVKEFSISRGVDFQKVANVLNFDFPKSIKDYIHRVGRTARGYSSGMALSFVTGDEISLLQEAQEELGNEQCMRPYQFAMKEIEGFRYRCLDAMRVVTKQAIKDARLRELKVEILNSEKLKAYFEQNPRDLQVLQHNSILRPSKVKSHMKHIPDYLGISKFSYYFISPALN